MLRAHDIPRLGSGIGVRAELFPLLRARPDLATVFELMPEHVLESSPASAAALYAAIGGAPVITHSVSLSLGSAGGGDREFLAKMREVSDAVDAPWASDHLCFTRIGKRDLGQLVPVPYTHEALEVVIANVREAQRALARPLALENVTRYFSYKHEDYTEAEFFAKLVEATGCFALLDVTNVLNNSENAGWDVDQYVRDFPLDSTIHLHLGGVHHDDVGVLDTHAGPVPEAAWRLAERVIARAPVKAVILERDDGFDDVAEIIAELERARGLLAVVA